MSPHPRRKITREVTSVFTQNHIKHDLMMSHFFLTVIGIKLSIPLTRHGARSWNRNLHSHIFCHKSKPLSDRKMATLYYARIIAFLSNLPIKMHDILALKITNTHKNTAALQECSGSSALLNSCVRWHTFLSRGNKYIHCISILEFSEQGGCKLHQILGRGG